MPTNYRLIQIKYLFLQSTYHINKSLCNCGIGVLGRYTIQINFLLFKRSRILEGYFLGHNGKFKANPFYNFHLIQRSFEGRFHTFHKGSHLRVFLSKKN